MHSSTVPYEVVFAPKERDTWKNRRRSHRGKWATYNPGKTEFTQFAGFWAKDPSSQDDLLAPFENANTGQPSVADLQVEPSGENPNKRKYAIHDCVRENQESYNKKMKKSRNKVEDFKIDEFVSIKIDKVDKTSPLHPNVLLGKVTEVDDNYAKIVTKFGIISTYISTSRLN